MEDIKVIATYRNGYFVPKSRLEIPEGKEVELIINDDLYESFTIAGQDSNVENSISAQSEIVLKNE
jgi:predicted DNA-binding antitoxin AbrB/MazE fold protein